MGQLHLYVIVVKVKTINAMKMVVCYYLPMVKELRIPPKTKKSIETKLGVVVFVAPFVVMPQLMMLTGCST